MVGCCTMKGCSVRSGRAVAFPGCRAVPVSPGTSLPAPVQGICTGCLPAAIAGSIAGDIVLLVAFPALGCRHRTRSLDLSDLGFRLISSDSSRSQTLILGSGLSLRLLGPLIQQIFMSDLDIQIPTAFDPFADANAENSGAGTKEYVHIRVQQRNGRKSLTTVQGLKKDFSYNKILKDLKKEFCCNGTVVEDPELGQVIQLQGDQRKNVSSFLIQAGIVKKDHIKIHGF
ncbi:hypothetical protein ACOSQ2_030819 [Xanthoceras sorbifolium]